MIRLRILTLRIFIIIYDFFSFNNINVIRNIVSQHDDKKLKLDLREDLALQFQKIVEPLLISSLGDRISEMCFNVYQESVCIGKTEEPFSKFLIGLKLNPLKANSVIERGPTANLPEVIFFFFLILNINVNQNNFCYSRLKNSVHFGVRNLN